MTEVWAESIADGYEVSTLGRVRNAKTGKILSPEMRDNHRGRRDPRVGVNGRHYTVARLVASAFVARKDGQDTVNHIDGDITNNIVTNIEWTSRADNSRKACRDGNFYRPRGSVEFSPLGEGESVRYRSIKFGADDKGCQRGLARRACRNGGIVVSRDGTAYRVKEVMA